MDPKKIKEALALLAEGKTDEALAILQALASAPEGDDLADTGAAVAASARLCALTGRQSVGEAIEDVVGWQSRISKIADETAKLEASQRRELVGTLVKLGFEFPSTAWAGDPTERVPCDRLAKEPIADLRSRVAALSAARGGAPAAKFRPPVSDSDPENPEAPKALTRKLSAREQAYCTKHNLTPEQFADRKSNAVSTL